MLNAALMLTQRFSPLTTGISDGPHSGHREARCTGIKRGRRQSLLFRRPFWLPAVTVVAGVRERLVQAVMHSCLTFGRFVALGVASTIYIHGIAPRPS